MHTLYWYESSYSYVGSQARQSDGVGPEVVPPAHMHLRLPVRPKLRLNALAVERRHRPGIRRPGHLAIGVWRRPAPLDLLEDLTDSSCYVAHAAGDGLNCNAIRGDLQRNEG